jgi:purine-binding chemotaxis protein CheW
MNVKNKGAYMEQQLVIFELEKEFYGVDIKAVESIIKMQAITRMPHSPAFVEGVTNLRGKVLPVIDLRRRFGLPSQKDTKDSRIVVVSMGSADVGMIVDGVSEVLTLQDADIEPAPHMVTTADSGFITGIVKLPGRLVILLDLAAVLSAPEQSSLQALPANI